MREKECEACVNRIHFSLYTRRFVNTMLCKQRGDGGRVECTVEF